MLLEIGYWIFVGARNLLSTGWVTWSMDGAVSMQVGGFRLTEARKQADVNRNHHDVRLSRILLCFVFRFRCLISRLPYDYCSMSSILDLGAGACIGYGSGRRETCGIVGSRRTRITCRKAGDVFLNYS